LPALLPFSLKTGTIFDRNLYPVLWLCETLLYSVSIPFFVLSTTAPILQKWFSYSNHDQAQNPYFLYSASNIGSLIALLSYPFIIEPFLSLNNQTTIWSGLFVLFAIFIFYITTNVTRHNKTETEIDVTTPDAPSLKQKIGWCFLSFIPSSLMLGVTSHITTDIAAMPLLWIMPFALYLISFICAFSKNMWGYKFAKKTLFLAIITSVLVGIFTNAMREHLQIPTIIIISILFITFFMIALLYHGTLVENKPDIKHLTYFYFCMSIGGALGGIFNAILAPVIFAGVYEYYLVLFLSLLIFLPRFDTIREYFYVLTPTFLIIIGYYFYIDKENNTLFIERNFFGLSKVTYDDTLKARKYVHGTTNHGMQSTLEKYRLKPTTYYTGMNDFINLLPKDVKQKPIAMVGLGVGTSVSYAQKNQAVDIFEIDPVVIKIANNPDLFTYMRDCNGNKKVILGDARIKLQEADPKRYGFMIMDAYSSDSLPVHLITKEALEMYLSKLDDNGIIAFHISNRHLDLKPVLASLMTHFDLAGYVRTDMKVKKISKNSLAVANQWVILTKNPELFENIKPDDKWQPLVSSNHSLWTDNYSSILSILK
jgi:hypothetical protein